MMKNLFLLPWFILSLIFFQCRSVSEPREVAVVVRKERNKVITGVAEYSLIRRDNGQVVSSGRTNELGYALIKRPKAASFADLSITAVFDGLTSTISLNPFNPFYDI